MKFTVLALVLVSAASAGAQQSTGTIYGHPIRRNPVHTPVPPPMPISRFNPQVGPRPSRPQPQHVTYLPGYLYYNPFAQYAAPAQTNVTVNVTNVTPPTEVVVIAPSGLNYGSNIGYGGGVELGTQRSRPTPLPDEFRATPTAPTSPVTRSLGVAEPADVGSIDAVVHTLYDVISGPPSKGRDWERFRGLFAEGARLIATGSMPGLPARATVMTTDEYATNAAPLLSRGFFEKEIARSVEQFGRIAHVFSTYEARYGANDPKPFQRGINSIQLLNDGTRWWILSVYWDAERPDNPIPTKYLNPRQQ